MRVIFMGTPAFAVPALQRLAIMPEVTVVAVVTRRDQPAGRGNLLTLPPVKIAAESLGLPVLQPGSLKRAEAQAQLAALAPDVIVVAAFGQILPPAVLDLPPLGCLNIHASLLPRYRGASPIATAILDGEEETGNTIMVMDAGLDTGPILAMDAFGIQPDDTTGSLTARLAADGADLLARILPAWEEGFLAPMPQYEPAATMTRPLRKEDGIIDWRQPATLIERQVRAYIPWPGASTTWHGQPLKIHAARVAAAIPLEVAALAPGRVVNLGSAKAMVPGIVCGDQTVLALETIQLPGKRALPAAEVVRGQPALVGAMLPS